MRSKSFHVSFWLGALWMLGLLVGCDQRGGAAAPVASAPVKKAAIGDGLPPSVEGPAQISVKSIRGDVFVGRKEGAGTLVTNVAVTDTYGMIETRAGAVADLVVHSQKLIVVAPDSVVRIEQAETNTYGCYVQVRLRKGEAVALGRQLIMPLTNGGNLVWTPRISILTRIGDAYAREPATFSASEEGFVNCFDGPVEVHGVTMDRPPSVTFVTVKPESGERVDLKTMKVGASKLRNVDEYLRGMTNR